MPHWKLTVAYDGTPYNGWQIQPGLPTIQGTLAKALHHITGESVLPQGSGRTDTGVHALGQVASRLTRLPPFPPPISSAPSITSFPPVSGSSPSKRSPADFHARHSARRKTYEYRISTQSICPPTLAPFVWNCTWPLDLAAMQQGAAHVIGTHDFTSFAASDPDLANRNASEEDDDTIAPTPAKTAIRSIFASTWHREGDLLLYRVTGSGFLHHMVRNLVGTFVDVGRGRTAADAHPQQSSPPALAPPQAPPHPRRASSSSKSSMTPRHPDKAISVILSEVEGSAGLSLNRKIALLFIEQMSAAAHQRITQLATLTAGAPRLSLAASPPTADSSLAARNRPHPRTSLSRAGTRRILPRSLPLTRPHQRSPRRRRQRPRRTGSGRSNPDLLTLHPHLRASRHRLSTRNRHRTDRAH